MRNFVYPALIFLGLLFLGVRQEKLLYSSNRLQGDVTTLQMTVEKQQDTIHTLTSQVDSLLKIHPWQKMSR